MPKRLVTLRSGGFLVAVVALGALAGCTGEAEPQPPAATPAPPATSGLPAPSGPAADYDATGVRLCDATDLTPLKKLGLTARKTAAKAPASAPGSACLFTLRSKDGHDGSLLVEAATPESAEQAELLYRATGSVTDMVDEGALPGLGDEAEGFSGQSTASGEKTTECLVHARTGNLVVKAFLTVGGDDYPNKQAVAAPAREIVAGTIRLITKK